MQLEFGKFFRRGMAVAGFIGTVVAILVFPTKIDEAYDVTVRTLGRLPRPVFAALFQFDGARDSTARKLIKELHPGHSLCTRQVEAGDLVGKGWKADLAITYSPEDPSSGCEYQDEWPYLVVFTPRGFWLDRVGVARDGGGTGYTFEVVGRLILQYYEIGTQFPWYKILYVYNNKLQVSDVTIGLEGFGDLYEFHYRPIENGLLGWGTPDGLFHLIVSADGAVTKAFGPPPTLARPDITAISLYWDGETFRRQPEGEVVAPTTNTESWPEFMGTLKKDGVVTELYVQALDRLYIGGCRPASGFSESASLPGALIPKFTDSPQLKCGSRDARVGGSLAIVDVKRESNDF